MCKLFAKYLPIISKGIYTPKAILLKKMEANFRLENSVKKDVFGFFLCCDYNVSNIHYPCHETHFLEFPC
jgi:hypothetical protein